MAIKDSLSEIHGGLGASFTEFEGFLVPDSYGNPESEWSHVRKAVGLLDLPYRAALEMTGADSARFLQGMVSNDVEALGEGEGTYATVLTQQGKIVGDLRIYRTGRGFLLETLEPIRQRVVEHLERFLVADEVEICPLLDQSFLALQGPRSAEVLDELQFSVPEGEYRHVSAELTRDGGGPKVFCARAGLTGESGFLLLPSQTDLEPVWSRLLEVVVKLGGGPVGFRALQVLRMEAGIPWYGTDFDDSNFPLEAGLDRIVSQSKGCYLGQEVVERIRARGHINQRLVAFRLEGQTPPSKGAAVFEGERRIGQIKSAVFSFGLRCPLAFGYVHRDSARPGLDVTIQNGAEAYRATIAFLPGV